MESSRVPQLARLSASASDVSSACLSGESFVAQTGTRLSGESSRAFPELAPAHTLQGFGSLASQDSRDRHRACTRPKGEPREDSSWWEGMSLSGRHVAAADQPASISPKAGLPRSATLGQAGHSSHWEAGCSLLAAGFGPVAWPLDHPAAMSDQAAVAALDQSRHSQQEGSLLTDPWGSHPQAKESLQKGLCLWSGGSQVCNPRQEATRGPGISWPRGSQEGVPGWTQEAETEAEAASREAAQHVAHHAAPHVAPLRHAVSAFRGEVNLDLALTGEEGGEPGAHSGPVKGGGLSGWRWKSSPDLASWTASQGLGGACDGREGGDAPQEDERGWRREDRHPEGGEEAEETVEELSYRLGGEADEGVERHGSCGLESLPGVQNMDWPKEESERACIGAATDADPELDVAVGLESLPWQNSGTGLDDGPRMFLGCSWKELIPNQAIRDRLRSMYFASPGSPGAHGQGLWSRDRASSDGLEREECHYATPPRGCASRRGSVSRSGTPHSCSTPGSAEVSPVLKRQMTAGRSTVLEDCWLRGRQRPRKGSPDLALDELEQQRKEEVARFLDDFTDFPGVKRKRV